MSSIRKTLTGTFLACVLAVWVVDKTVDFTHPQSRYELAKRETVLIKTERGQGSGVVVFRENLNGARRIFVWTAAHVVHNFNEVKVCVPIRSELHKVGETSVNATVVLRDEKSDVALLLLDGCPDQFFSPAKFDSEVTPGALLYHVGNFFGDVFDGSLSTGILSQVGVAQSDADWPWPVCDSTTLLIVPGSSGGPVFCDKHNRVVGLAVGIVGGQVHVYVPTRELSRICKWAVVGDWCPSDNTLKDMALVAHVSPPPPVLLQLIFR
jgi:S1-C subfamily serine protease